LLKKKEKIVRGFSADDPQKFGFLRKIDFFKISVAKNPDLIEQNQGHFRTQSIKISLIQLENPGRFSKHIFLLPSVIHRPINWLTL
jgi:hypothetical protein